jgi:hypothetical protein
MSLSITEIAFMKNVSLTELGEIDGSNAEERGGESWFFQADRAYGRAPEIRSSSLQEIEKRLTQSKRQSKDQSLTWRTVSYKSGSTEGKGLVIQGLNRAQAVKFAYKLKLSSILFYASDKSFVISTGFKPKKQETCPQ